MEEITFIFQVNGSLKGECDLTFAEGERSGRDTKKNGLNSCLNCYVIESRR